MSHADGLGKWAACICLFPSMLLQAKSYSMIACASHREGVEACALRLPESTSGSLPARLRMGYARVPHRLLRIGTQSWACHADCLSGPSASQPQPMRQHGNGLRKAGLGHSCIELRWCARQRVWLWKGRLAAGWGGEACKEA